MCMRQTGKPVSAAASNAPSRRSERTSLIRPAPSRAHSRITAGVEVSTEITTSSSPAMASTMGATRSSSSVGETERAPGRVDSPPTSISVAPAATIAWACRNAASRSAKRPPSEKESGVTLRIPMTWGRERSRARLPQTSRAGEDELFIHEPCTFRPDALGRRSTPAAPPWHNGVDNLHQKGRLCAPSGYSLLTADR